eukprot:2709999-Rhodomonas_salina.1
MVLPLPRRLCVLRFGMFLPGCRRIHHESVHEVIQATRSRTKRAILERKKKGKENHFLMCPYPGSWMFVLTCVRWYQSLSRAATTSTGRARYHNPICLRVGLCTGPVRCVFWVNFGRQFPEKVIPKFILRLLNGQKACLHGQVSPAEIKCEQLRSQYKLCGDS